ncbi:GGDEF domain-containing phosphodiesterase, partial [Lysobacter sp. A3-1-A15]
ASIGIAIGDMRYHTTDELLHDADVALYRAKSGGRSRFVLFDETLQLAALDVLEVERELRTAIAHGGFEPYFQPLVRLSDGHPIGYEALIRWHHPERGLLGPDQFLPVAEESGLIEAVDWAM